VIDKQRAESEQHRASVRQRRSTSVVDDDEENIDEIVGTYASHNEVNATISQSRLVQRLPVYLIARESSEVSYLERV